MQVSRVIVPLEREEADALFHMAETDCRPPREQMRWLLIREARRRKLLDVVTQPDSTELDEVSHEFATTN